MKQRGWIVLKTLFNRYDADIQEKLLKFLPPESKTKLMETNVQSSNLLPLLYQHQDTLERMHYSWIKPLLQHFPEQLVPLLINSLKYEQALGFKSHLNSEMELPQTIKFFFQNQLYTLIDVIHRQPLELLPVTEMTPLAYMDKQDLMNIFDFLGLYDLSSEVRRIVNNAHLKNIYACLTPKQFHYLKFCMHQKEKLITPSLGIDHSKQDCPKLKQLIHRRGLLRLAKAMCGQPKDLVWYIAHVLDTGRGKVLMDHYKENEIPGITSSLKLQLINVMNFLKSE